MEKYSEMTTDHEEACELLPIFDKSAEDRRSNDPEEREGPYLLS
jgi:hypothetical protein